MPNLMVYGLTDSLLKPRTIEGWSRINVGRAQSGRGVLGEIRLEAERARPPFDAILLVTHGLLTQADGGESIGGGFHLGTGQVDRMNLVQFTKPLQGYVRHLYIFGCSVAKLTPADTSKNLDGDGPGFCQEMANQLGASVYASSEVRTLWMWYNTLGEYAAKLDKTFRPKDALA